MNVQTTQFGTVDVSDDRIIDFSAGLLGFSNFRRFALLQPDEWLLIADGKSGRTELFDLASDPRGLTPLDEPKPEALAAEERGE